MPTLQWEIKHPIGLDEDPFLWRFRFYNRLKQGLAGRVGNCASQLTALTPEAMFTSDQNLSHIYPSLILDLAFNSNNFTKLFLFFMSFYGGLRSETEELGQQSKIVN